MTWIEAASKEQPLHAQQLPLLAHPTPQRHRLCISSGSLDENSKNAGFNVIVNVRVYSIVLTHFHLGMACLYMSSKSMDMIGFRV